MANLDPQIARWLEKIAQRGPLRLNTLPVTEARQLWNRAFDSVKHGDPVARQVDVRVADRFQVRVYTPPGEGPFPALVYYHGGGFILGDLDTHDEWCRYLCLGAVCVVVAVEYRKAPEHPFPAAVEDAYDGLMWAIEQADHHRIDASRVAIGGDSAGGNLAAVVAQLARDREAPPLMYQLLLYPITDFTRMDTSSYQQFGEGYFLERIDMEWFRTAYVPSHADQHNSHASPLLRGDLSGLPPAFVATAEYDPLRDEGESYAKRLLFARVPVTLRRYPGLIHSFATLGHIDSVKLARREIAQELRQSVRPRPALR